MASLSRKEEEEGFDGGGRLSLLQKEQFDILPSLPLSPQLLVATVYIACTAASAISERELGMDGDCCVRFLHIYTFFTILYYPPPLVYLFMFFNFCCSYVRCYENTVGRR